ncbi:MAG: acyltransferase [Candidatus Dormibacteraeota bacterium]|nr:acyltransferase [Candidatus Dormibacteraeota bacterium]
MRAVAMIGVICIHASAWGPASPYVSVDLISRFSVPAFMVLTGSLLAYQYTGRSLGVPFMRRRLGRSVVPWLVWAPVYILFDFWIGVLSARGASVLAFVEYGAGHLWFLLLIPQFYLLFAVWPRRGSWAVAVIAMLAQSALQLMRIYVVLPGWQSQVVLSFAVMIFPFWIGYFAVGVAAGRTLARLGGEVWSDAVRIRVAVIGPVAVAASGYLLLNLHYPSSPYAKSFLTGTGAFLNPVLPVFMFSVVVWLFGAAPLLMRAWSPFARAVNVLSEQSLGLYIVHPILLWFIGRWLVGAVDSTGAASAAGFGAFILLTLLATMLVVRLLQATPLAVTIGTPRRQLGLASLRLAGGRRTAQTS